eukprot:gene1375-1578_t
MEIKEAKESSFSAVWGCENERGPMDYGVGSSKFEKNSRLVGENDEATKDMTTYIDLSSPEELYHDLVNQIASIKKKRSVEFNASQYQNLIAEQRDVEILSRLITSESEFLFKESDKEIEGFFNIILTVLHKLENDAINVISQKIRDTLSSNPSEKSQLKVKLYEVFFVLVKLAADSNNIEFVKNQLKNIDSWLVDWSSSTQQKRKIYKLISSIFKEKNRDDAAEAVDDSVQACIESISLQELYQSDYLLDLDAVRHLETSSAQQHKLTYELMKIFATEQLDSFMAFQSRNPAFLAEINLSADDCLQKIRLLSLATLTSEDAKVPYASISKSLQIEEDQVEMWVINAIAGELIDAKLDQLNRLVHVNSSTQRVFNKAQWTQLGMRVDAWRTGVKNLLNVIETAKNTQVKPFYWQSR